VLLPGSINLELRHICVGYARKVCRMLSPNAVLISKHALDGICLRLMAGRKPDG